ncbi:hypothetical protein [Desulforudis sp. 1088]
MKYLLNTQKWATAAKLCNAGNSLSLQPVSLQPVWSLLQVSRKDAD